jgi:hypothetical protein
MRFKKVNQRTQWPFSVATVPLPEGDFPHETQHLYKVRPAHDELTREHPLVNYGLWGI